MCFISDRVGYYQIKLSSFPAEAIYLPDMVPGPWYRSRDHFRSNLPDGSAPEFLRPGCTT